MAPLDAGPNIDYHPNLERHLMRSAKIREASEKNGRLVLPPGFPSQINSKMTWSGEALKTEEWLLPLAGAQLDEIERALRHFQNLQQPFGLIAQETFPLPTLGPFIRDTIADQIYNGIGFAVLRGIPVEKYDNFENAIIYAGICSWLGPLRGKQDPASDIVLRHIIDLSVQGEIGTAQYTADSQPYHTDWGDIVTLYCLSTPAKGGTSHLASLETIYNELAKHRPDIIGVLSENWAFDNFGSQPPYIVRPLMFYHGGHVILQYSRRLFTGYQTYKRSDICPPLTEEQIDAMEELEFMAQKCAVSFQFEKGDIQMFNNMGLLHGRDAYTDDKQNVRELLRIWARNEDFAWDLPPQLVSHWQNLYYTARPETQIFFPDDLNTKQIGDQKLQEGKTWVFAGNEGGIPDS